MGNSEMFSRWFLRVVWNFLVLNVIYDSLGEWLSLFDHALIGLKLYEHSPQIYGHLFIYFICVVLYVLCTHKEQILIIWKYTPRKYWHNWRPTKKYFKDYFTLVLLQTLFLFSRRILLIIIFSENNMIAYASFLFFNLDLSLCDPVIQRPHSMFSFVWYMLWMAFPLSHGQSSLLKFSWNCQFPSCQNLHTTHLILLVLYVYQMNSKLTEALALEVFKRV